MNNRRTPHGRASGTIAFLGICVSLFLVGSGTVVALGDEPIPTILSHGSAPSDQAEIPTETGGIVPIAIDETLAGSEDELIQPVGYRVCNQCSLSQESCRCRRRRIARMWDSDLEIGLNGAEGNSRNVNLVLGYDAKRVRGRTTTTIDIDYLFSKDDVETTKNRLYSLWRWEYDPPDSDWGWFFDKWFEYDRLEDFRARLGIHIGRFATLWKTDDCELKGLFGLGTSKEFEGDDTAWKPELYIGSSLEKQINDRQSIYYRWMYMPDIGDFGSFRFRIKAGWDFELNREGTLILSLSMFDRYDSTPSGSDRKNDIDYWASLSWSF